MTAETPLPEDVVASLNDAGQRLMNVDTSSLTGVGKAHHMVAQSAAIAVQDAEDGLRNLSLLAGTAAGVAMSEMLAAGDPRNAAVLDATQQMKASAADAFDRITTVAANAVETFPKS
ncbi:hypothetical protein DMC25_02600 [Caulobacter sp. D4A]|uniref:hypothetical protein n=1 Tax=unclassified Caulobacter TaxID=2648921 RepID=UPI000D7334B5|nr:MULTISPECIES: hypothetical protein [unclassified Caulobacter]PXA91128.1 hypothetical protein DMC18_13790 [Caulobacter sp. D5]PXA94302.1 hypothetical protein DMC25_02600 [Caulobacter sp. D4A]